MIAYSHGVIPPLYLKEVIKKYKPEELINDFFRLAKVDKDYICSRGKNRTERAMLIEMKHRHCQTTQPEIGLLTGGIDYN